MAGPIPSNAAEVRHGTDQATHESTGCSADSLKPTSSPTRRRLGLPPRSEQHGARVEQLQEEPEVGRGAAGGRAPLGAVERSAAPRPDTEPLRAEQSSHGLLLAASPQERQGQTGGRGATALGGHPEQVTGAGAASPQPIGRFRQAGPALGHMGVGRGLRRALSTGLVIKPHPPGQPRPQPSHPRPLYVS